jgi:hypothetical protein
LKLRVGRRGARDLDLDLDLDLDPDPDPDPDRTFVRAAYASKRTSRRPTAECRTRNVERPRPDGSVPDTET